jgi:glycosyltransferase involved in cell wall biosynthesis
MTLRLCLVGNEPRQSLLFSTLREFSDVVSELGAEDVGRLDRCVALASSFSWPKSEWWQNYQMSTTLQTARQRALLNNLRSAPDPVDALLMWGSWFRPLSPSGKNLKYFNYIDQSYSLNNLPGESKGRWARRAKAHRLQYETYRNAGAVFCMSRWARDQTLASYELDESKVIVVGWGPCSVDLSKESFDFGSQPTPRPIVLHISNDFRRKGVDYLIECARILKKSNPETIFRVIGRDSSKLAISEADRALVEFTGPIYDPVKLSNQFRNASVFFMPHRFDRSPHAIVEAMGAGLPVVTSAQGGAIELFEDGQAGMLCPPGDVRAYATALEFILSNNEPRARMGNHARLLVQEKYNWPAVAKKIITSIEKLLASA